MRRREVVEDEQLLPVPHQVLGGPGLLRLPGGEEACERLLRPRAGVGPPYLVQHRLRFALNAFGQLVEDVRRLVHPARCAHVSGYTSARANQNPNPPSPTASFTAFTPRSRRLNNTVFQLSLDSRNPDSRARKCLWPCALQPTTTSRQRHSPLRTFT